MAARKARCPYCGTLKPVTDKGKIRRHYVTAGVATVAETGSRIVCGGSGRPA